MASTAATSAFSFCAMGCGRAAGAAIEFQVCASKPASPAYAALCALIGTVVGVLPGLGPVATIALLLPVSFHMSPEGALILLAGGLGVLASTGKLFDVLSLAAFGLFGHAARRGGFPLLPLLMGFVIAAPFEDHLRPAITHARGDWLALAAEPGVAIVTAGAALVVSGARRLGRTNR